MATNPMQRKARNSFLLGIVVTLLITGAVIAFLILQLKNYKDKEAEEKANSTKVWVLSENVISGQIITTDMLTQQVTNKNLVPSNAIGDMSILSNYALTDKEGNEITTEYKNNNGRSLCRHINAHRFGCSKIYNKQKYELWHDTHNLQINSCDHLNGFVL